jgi:glyceraldehyde-3-phosphate dehydrogenase/erythrose-4-phosphate dehydrogenase
MLTRVAINGFGRVGRCALRAAHERGPTTRSVIDGTQVKVVSWDDNEWGYSSRVIELAARVIAPVAEVV